MKARMAEGHFGPHALLLRLQPVRLACRKLHFIITTFRNRIKITTILTLLLGKILFLASLKEHDTYEIPLKPTHHTDSICGIKIGRFNVKRKLPQAVCPDIVILQQSGAF